VSVEGRFPTLEYEAAAWSEGYCCVAGLDEAGRGAWAGPVVAAAVVLPPGDLDVQRRLDGVCDSKQLTAARRETYFAAIREHALCIGVGAVPSSEIDTRGIVAATRQAMSLALQSLPTPADYLLIDYLSLPGWPLPQVSLPKGDARVFTIAAASIVAKVSRDRMMVDLDGRFPGYGFARHKGYGTRQHQSALASLGPCDVHRFSFSPVEASQIALPQDFAGPGADKPI
jgi:ribonuclease HII